MPCMGKSIIGGGRECKRFHNRPKCLIKINSAILCDAKMGMGRNAVQQTILQYWVLVDSDDDEALGEWIRDTSVDGVELDGIQGE